MVAYFYLYVMYKGVTWFFELFIFSPFNLITTMTYVLMDKFYPCYIYFHCFHPDYIILCEYLVVCSCTCMQISSTIWTLQLTKHKRILGFTITDICLEIDILCET